MPWEFERNGEIIRINPTGQLIVRVSSAMDLAADAAIACIGILTLFEGRLDQLFDL